MTTVHLAGDQSSFSLVFQLIKGFDLQSLENFYICSLYLPVASWVGHRGEAHLGAHFFAEVEEGFACELSAVVGDDSVWYSEPVDDPLDELDGGLGRLAWNWHHFHPFCELVDCHEQVLVTSHRLWYLADDVQPPERERPGDWYWLQRLS